MSTLAQARPLNFQPPPWLAWLRRELAPFPGRQSMTIRLVVTAVAVTIISMSLRVPQLAFSVFFCFFVTRENRVLTTFTGLLMICGATIAVAANLLLYNYTFDYPELRVPVMACFIFGAMFLSRTFVIGPLGFVVGFFTALMLTIGEGAPNTEELVRGELWLWVAIVYPIALTVFINQILLPADPWAALVRALNLRLDAASAALERIIRDGYAGGQTNRLLLDLATRGGAIMFNLLNFSETKDPRLKRRHPFLVETIASATHLVSATASLEFREPRVQVSESDLHCVKSLLADLAQLKAVLPETERVLSARENTLPHTALPQLRELRFAVESFRDSLVRGGSDYSSTNVPQAKKPLFSPDAFTNPIYPQFALKVTLAAMICYLLYSGLNWPGISTSFVTCCFIALGNTGATIYKSWLRLFGCMAGGACGYLAIFFLLPHMVSITTLLILTVVGSAVAGWIAAGSERIAYAGLQFAFAFYLSIFQGFEPEFSLTTVRDRVAGILIGTVVSALIFRFIWPEHAADQLRVALGKMLREVSQLMCLPKADPAAVIDSKKTTALHNDLSKGLDNVLVLSEHAEVENVMFPNPRGFSNRILEHITSHVQSLGLISTGLLRRTKVEEWQRLEPPVQAAEWELRDAIADHLQKLAAFVETGKKPGPDDLDSAYAQWTEATANVTGNDRPRLVRRLVDQVRGLM